MDLLLRDLARRERAAAATPRAFESSSKRETSRIGDQSHSTHLDADELSSYAEGALPEMTRARYTAHLADCQRCRKLITELALAAGVNAAVRPVEKAASSSLWKKLSAFFSPPVLRYAVPALALFAVIAVAVIGLRERQEAPFVAQNTETAARGTVADTKAPNEPATAATPFADALARKQVESVRTAASNTAVSNQDKKKLAEKEEVSKQEVAATSISGSLAKDSPAPKPSDAETQPTFAAEPPPAPPAKEQVKTADARRADEVRQQEQVAEERDAAVAGKREEQLRPGVKADQNTSAPQTAIAARRAKPLGVGRGSSAGGVTMDSTDDVRTVGGRRFRRQGQTWIDTAYDASHSAISVVRGSEQYRALVADEPGIRTIAEQLQGEVVLVWKGRTYRIR